VTTKRLIAKLRRLLRSDDGIGLVEVLVALMVFSIIAVGMAYSMLAMSRLTGETTAREAATNLAAQEVDRIQARSDIFNVEGGDTTTELIDGVRYTIATNIGWVTTTGLSSSCGAGGGNLLYKRVNVQVTWPGMYLKNPVRADSVLAPDARINDPRFGTILIAVTGEDGTGRAGATVTVTPVSGGALAIVGTIDATDSDGCAYVLKVNPGIYKVQISKAGYLSKVDQQPATPSKDDLQVTAGATATVAVTYDDASSFTLKYGANATQAVSIPTNLEVTFSGGLSDIVKTTPASPLKLYPMPNGYQAIAGNYANCKNVDPAKWTEITTLAAGARAESVGTEPGGTGLLPIPMGVLQVQIPNDTTKRYVTAVQVGTAGNGNPGCSSIKNYTFPQFAKNSTQNIALPYGTWNLYYGNTSGATTTQITSGGAITVLGSVIQSDGLGGLLTNVIGGSAVAGSGTVTLDPRVPQ
jgi:type II secretory pathway pseudopilin PulG